jgi:ADP-ribosyl-[dinitrogen reductase] hydrolase
MAVNLGDDADTTGAIYGEIAGAHYGLKGLPEAWRERVYLNEHIETLAAKLVAAHE